MELKQNDKIQESKIPFKILDDLTIRFILNSEVFSIYLYASL